MCLGFCCLSCVLGFLLMDKQKTSEGLIPFITVQPRIELVVLSFIICVAAFFRLYHLGESAFRADTMIFVDFVRQPLGPLDFFSQWTTTLGMDKGGQFPFTVAWTKLFFTITGAPVTPFMVRLPSAVWGILAVLAVYGAGRVLAGNAFALFAAALFALDPFHIGVSREAYFYPPLVCGSALLLWSIFLQVRAVRDSASLPVIFYVFLAFGFFLTTYAQPSSWLFAFVSALIILWFQIKNSMREKCAPRSLVWILLVLVIIGLPLLFSGWALPQMIRASSAEHKEYVRRVFGSNPESAFFTMARTLFSFGWGATLSRTLFTIAVVVLGVAATIRLWRCSVIMPVLVVLLGAGMLLFVAARYLLLEQAVSSRYLLAYLPLYLLWLSIGLWFVPAMLRGRGKILVMLSYIVMAAALVLNLWPAYLATQLTGKPIPYWDIARWCDKNLPPHTLVLVERWLDPWNELRVHNSTNVYFTFTVPSEPQDVFKQVNWPLTARQFMEKFPDAAYLEFSRADRDVKGVVTNWSFARSVSFTNEAGIRLAKMGLAHREEFFAPNANRLIATIFYNSREDVLAHAREQGKRYLVLYGPEWEYVKLWQQLRDFRDWRILERQAVLDVYNLTAATNSVTLQIRGMALNGLKRVSVIGGCAREEYHDFRHMQLDGWEIKGVSVKPGLNKIVLSDSLWSVSKIPLLVDHAEIIPEAVKN